jgi:hypothetical protein
MCHSTNLLISTKVNMHKSNMTNNLDTYTLVSVDLRKGHHKDKYFKEMKYMLSVH